MPRLVIYTMGLLVSTVVMTISNVNSIPFVISSGLLIGFAIPLLDAIIANHRHLRIAWYGLRTWRHRVRVSVSYLYRIRVDNEYLLVKGNRFEQYQPVGGVYKYHPSSAETRNALRLLDDDLLVPDDVSEGDLRVRVPGRKLVAFVRWFENGSGRETDGWREFYEETIATEILPGDHFRHIKYDHLERIYQPLRFSPWADSRKSSGGCIMRLGGTR
ncbi:hypothetical protein [Microbacterium esteraromaticum]|uniref:SMODS-associated NUDIX domain-containing protein n=1 Tax=Microbacterium esteraromaticum TaxID=57043 RepID=UPI003CC7F32B